MDAPDWWTKHCAAAEATIADLLQRIAAERKAAEPEIRYLVQHGDYMGERELGRRLQERVERLLQEIAYFERQIPPHTILRADGYMERVPQKEPA